MSVFEQIKADLTKARLAKDAFTSDTLRTLIGDIQLESTRPGAKPVEDITQQKLKAFTDGANTFIENTSDETIKADKLREIAIYTSYRPVQLPAEALRIALLAKFGTVENKGMAMGWLKTTYAGQYDGKVAGAVVDELIAK